MPGIPKYSILEKNLAELTEITEYELECVDLQPSRGAADYTHTNDNLTKAVFYKDPGKAAADRVLEVDITYSGDLPSTATYKYYSTEDGTTLLRTATITYTYTAEVLTSTSVVWT